MGSKFPVSILQELMVAKGYPYPVYVEEGFGIEFKCTVKVAGLEAVGKGTNKKTAKHESARKALQLLNHKLPEERTIVPFNENNNESVERSKIFVNYVGILNEYASQTMRTSFPVYVCDVESLGIGKFVMVCHFLKLKISGTGQTKKEAKQEAARLMLERLVSRIN